MGSIAAVHPLETQDLDFDAITAKYAEERAKRMRKDGTGQFIDIEGKYGNFKEDIWAPPLIRDPIHTETKVLVVGAGFGGLVTGVNLRKAGIDDFLIVEKGADFGGCWYWNQYPGVTCDVESILYLPFIEELGYVPKDRFSYGPEIRQHCARVVEKWNLRPQTHLQTEVVSITWDDSTSRWHTETTHGDHFVSHFVVLATGTQHKPKLPGIPGILQFKRDHFHSSRWDYSITGGDPTGNMTNLANKRVGIIGTGASAIQLVPKLAQDAGKLFVFQRTPSSISLRNEDPPEPAVIETWAPGWQKQKMEDFANILQGEIIDVESTAIEGLEAMTVREIHNEAKEAGVEFKPEKIPEWMRLADFRLMEKLRKIVEDTVKDKHTAEKLKPWYAFMCKRPGYNNLYLQAFNKPNVELVDSNGKGVDYLTENSICVDGKEYDIDLLIYSTGFEFEVGSNYYRRTGIKLLGSRGKTLDEKWESQEKGPSTLFGVHIRDFPNLFNIGPAQAGITANQLHNIYGACEHIAETIAKWLQDEEFQSAEPSEEAEEEWASQIEEGREMRLEYLKNCSPGYYNKEGRPEEIPARWGVYPKGIVAWMKVMREWREEGCAKGMDMRFAKKINGFPHPAVNGIEQTPAILPGRINGLQPTNINESCSSATATAPRKPWTVNEIREKILNSSLDAVTIRCVADALRLALSGNMSREQLQKFVDDCDSAERVMLEFKIREAELSRQRLEAIVEEFRCIDEGSKVLVL